MEPGYLIDTNVISHLFSDRLPGKGKDLVIRVINRTFLVSVVTEIEVLTYHEIPEKMPLIEEFMTLSSVLQLESNITRKAIELRRAQRKLKLADAIIAATALIHNLTLITNNVKDFKDIPGLEIIDPHSYQ